MCICGNEIHLATGSLDRTIRVWLLKDGELCQTLIGHTKGVWTLKFLSATLLISGGYDATIKVLLKAFFDENIYFYFSLRFGILKQVFVYEHFYHIMVQYGH